jgi:hypothetical protein
MTLGALLIAVGILLFLGQVMGFRNWDEFWPFIIVAVGGAFFAGMLLGGKQTSGLAVPGSIIVMVGLILFVQNTFNIWETWSYAWALIIVAVGVGVVIQGMWAGQPELRARGWQTVRTGAILFLIFGALMEFIFSSTGVSNRGGGLLWPVLLMVVAALWLVGRVYRLLTGAQDASTDLFWPVLLTGIGALATLSGLGWLPAWRLLSLLNLWPVLLIAAGLQLLFGRRSAWVSGLIGLLIVAALFFLGFAGDQLGLTDRTSWLFGPGMIIGDWPGGETVSGSGEAMQQTRNVSNFNEVSMAIPGEVKIVQGSSEALTISADDNLLEYITSEVRGRELVIDVRRGYRLQPKAKISVTLTVKELEALNLSSAANVTIDGLKTDELALNTSGVGDTTVNDLQSGALEVRISGMGSVKANGEARDVRISVSGAGNFVSPDLQSETAEVRISGAGQATLRVSERLDVDISGAGSVSYYGNPSVEKNISGAGSVRSLGD